MVVQRKWMYLESIFIGGDIRAQLPEEAKKFDNIDKVFKKVGTTFQFRIYDFCLVIFLNDICLLLQKFFSYRLLQVSASRICCAPLLKFNK